MVAYPRRRTKGKVVLLVGAAARIVGKRIVVEFDRWMQQDIDQSTRASECECERYLAQLSPTLTFP